MTESTDLEGKAMVVTGATSGIGLAALGALVARGAFVVGVGRSELRCREAEQSVLAAHPEAAVTFCVADLASQHQVRGLADQIAARLTAAGYAGLDVLVNNAGTVSSWFVATEDGYELQFAVNHLAPFLLTHDLLPLLRRVPEARVIVVSSGSHRRGKMHWKDVMLRRHYSILKAYKQSKFANVLFVAELNRRLGQDASIRAYAADPGLVNTEMGFKGTGGLARWVWERRRGGGVSPEEAARTVVFLATDPEARSSRGIYWKACRPVRPSRRAMRREDAARLWDLSCRLCGIPWEPQAVPDDAAALSLTLGHGAV